MHGTSRTLPRGVIARRALLVVAAAVAVVATGGQAATGRAVATAKPVIGPPVAVPRQPVAGRPFAVTFRVTRSDTHTPLAAGRMVCDPTIGGTLVPHRESFTGGVARLSLVVPATAGGRQLKVKVKIKAGGRSATRVSTFAVKPMPLPTLTVGDASVVEGTGGTTTLSFPVTLSAAAPRAVSARYTTADGTAVAPADYAAATGTLAFAPGERAKAIAVAVVTDNAIEVDETLTITLASPVNATIAVATATGRITNDDVAVPIAAGEYKGATQNGNYVFFSVRGDRTFTHFRVNDLPEGCTPDATLPGGVDFGNATIPIGNDGRFTGQYRWDGSEVVGDIEWTHEDVVITGAFTTASSTTGTILLNDELNYEGVHYRCSSGQVNWSATLQP